MSLTPKLGHPANPVSRQGGPHFAVMETEVTLVEEIEWWTRASRHSKTDAALIAFGVAAGLKIARADYGANDDSVLAPNRATASVSEWDVGSWRP